MTKDHCIVQTLKYYGFDEKQLDLVRVNLNCNLKKRDLKKIAGLLGIKFKLTQYDSKEKRYYYYGSEGKEYQIALYNNHYFPHVKTPVSLYMARKWKKYYRIRSKTTDYTSNFNKKKFRPLYDNNGKNKSGTDSLALIKYLDESSSFVHHEVFEDAPETTLIKDRKLNLGMIQNEIQFFADFETITTKKGKILPFMVGISDSMYNTRIFKSLEYDSEYLMNNVMDVALSSITVSEESEIIIYFHNLKFDKTFFDKLRVCDKCKKDGQYYSIRVLYRGRQIEFRDSYKLISAPLSKFGGMFDIKCAKQVIPYKLYNAVTIGLSNVRLEKAISLLKKQLKGTNLIEKKCEEFKESALPFIFEENNVEYFKHMDYMEYYLEMDCVTLGKGLSVFAETIKKVTGLDTVDSLTISSLMYKYCLENNVFEGQYEVTGNLKRYMAKAIYGGRVCTKDNKKWHIKTGVNTKSLISDFDGVSLYPSAIYRLCKEIGIPSGKPQKLSKKDIHLILAES